ncbi:MAG: Ig-like domain-containing protein, partial [Corallococcus sp.]|nr:Ig-like domain-containing protein [Corallococcus sp.]
FLYSDTFYEGNACLNGETVGVSVNLPPDNLFESYPHERQLTYSIIPYIVGDKSVTWSTSDPAVATVDDGLLTAVGAGTATITATTKNGTTASFTVNSYVFAESINVTGYETALPNINVVKMFPGDTLQVAAELLPANNNDPIIYKWSTGDSDVAAIDDSGKITAVNPGKTYVCYSPAYIKHNPRCSRFDIVVLEPFESISLSMGDEMSDGGLDYSKGVWKRFSNHYTLGQDCTWTLNAQTTGGSSYAYIYNGVSYTLQDKITYASSDTSVVSVSKVGLLRGKRGGDATITVSSDSGITEKMYIRVFPAVTIMNLSNITLRVGETVTLPSGWCVGSPYLDYSLSSGGVVNLQSDYEFSNGKIYWDEPITLTGVSVGTTSLTFTAYHWSDASIQECAETINITVTDAPLTLNDYTWEQIAEISESGNARDYFSVGDSKRITLTNGQSVYAVIMGFNHDAIDNNWSPTRAGITFGIVKLYATDTFSSQYSFQTFARSLLPTEVLNVITPVIKRTMKNDKSGNIDYDMLDVWQFSEVEITGTYASGFCDEGFQYDYWSMVKDGDLLSPVTSAFWLRTPVDSTHTRYVSDSTLRTYSDANTKSKGVCFGFCI